MDMETGGPLAQARGLAAAQASKAFPWGNHRHPNLDFTLPTTAVTEHQRLTLFE